MFSLEKLTCTDSDVVDREQHNGSHILNTNSRHPWHIHLVFRSLIVMHDSAYRHQYSRTQYTSIGSRCRRSWGVTKTQAATLPLTFTALMTSWSSSRKRCNLYRAPCSIHVPANSQVVANRTAAVLREWHRACHHVAEQVMHDGSNTDISTERVARHVATVHHGDGKHVSVREQFVRVGEARHHDTDFITHLRLR